MARFDERFIDEVRARTGLADLVGRYVTLRKAGREHLGLCPFHAERTPSFTVVGEKGFFHCFGCSAHGDAIDFLRRIENLEFPAAVERLALDAGLTLPGATGCPRSSHAGDDPATPEDEEPRKRNTGRRDAEERAARVEARRRENERRKAWARWRETVPITEGSPVDVYLREARGLDPVLYRPLPMLRMHPAMEYWTRMEEPLGGEHPQPPGGLETAEVSGRQQFGAGEYRFVNLGARPALVGACQGPDGRFQALHVTYIEADGSDKLRLLDEKGEKRAAKKVRGSPQGSALRLAAPAVIKNKVWLAGAEGIETALSVIQGGGVPCWGLYSLGNFAGRGRGRGSKHPLKKGARLPSAVPDMAAPGFLPPEGVEVFVWCRDADNGDPDAAACLVSRGAQRLLRMGLDVRVANPPEGMDFNDVLRAGQGRAA